MSSTVLAACLLLAFQVAEEQNLFTFGMLATCVLFDALAFSAADLHGHAPGLKLMKRFAVLSVAEALALTLALLVLRSADPWDFLGYSLVVCSPFITFALFLEPTKVDVVPEVTPASATVSQLLNAKPIATVNKLTGLYSEAIEDIVDIVKDETADMVAQHQELSEELVAMSAGYHDTQQLLISQRERNTDLRGKKECLSEALRAERDSFQDLANTLLARERRWRHSAHLSKIAQTATSRALTQSKQTASDAATRAEELSILLAETQIECVGRASRSTEDAARIVDLETSAVTCRKEKTNVALLEEARQQDKKIAHLEAMLKAARDEKSDLTLDFSMSLKAEEAKRHGVESTLMAADTEILRSREEHAWALHRMHEEIAAGKQALKTALEETANLKLNHSVALLAHESTERDLAASIRQIEEMEEIHTTAWTDAEEVLRSTISDLGAAKSEITTLHQDIEELEARAKNSTPVCRKRSLSEPLPGPLPLCLPSSACEVVDDSTTELAQSDDVTGDNCSVADAYCRESALQNLDYAVHGASNDKRGDISISYHDGMHLNDCCVQRPSLPVIDRTADGAADEIFNRCSVGLIDNDDNAAMPVANTFTSSATASNVRTLFPSIPTGPKGTKYRGRGEQGMLNRAAKKAAQKAARQEQGLSPGSRASAHSDTQIVDTASPSIGAPAVATAAPQRGVGMSDSRWASDTVDGATYGPADTLEQQNIYCSTQQLSSFAQPPRRYTNHAAPMHSAYATGRKNAYPGYSYGGRAYLLTPPPQTGDHVDDRGFIRPPPTGPRRAFVPLPGQDEDGKWMGRGGKLKREREKFERDSTAGPQR